MTDTRHSNEASRRELRRLVDTATGRAELEVIRDTLTQRLHRSSEDFDATYGLSLVSAQLSRTPFASPVVTASS
jgi:hypothetical protein